ncbi:MAG: hypothetical protein SF053_01795 [Bacteroidia bacterium]|nr:hypothetical protein [Bacteroidia bacterium]
MNPILRLCHKLAVILVLVGGAGSALRAQTTLSYQESVALFGKQRILAFRSFSLELTDESKAELKSIADALRVTPAILRTNLLVIQIFTCEQELDVKPYIGICRGQVIIDYLEKTLGIPRKKCLIRDLASANYDPDCLAGSGMTLYLKPDWDQ